MDEAAWAEWEAVYEAPLCEEAWAIYEQMWLDGLECVFSLELMDDLWVLKPNLPQTQARDKK